MAQSEQINELAAALVAAQAEFETISKDSVNPFYKSKYAGLPEVMKTAGPVLSKNGLAVMQFLSHEQAEAQIIDTLTTWLVHKSGQYMNDTMRLHLAKTDPQGHGSATTYARRYSYMSALGLVAEEDDDGNKASKQAVSSPASEYISQDQYTGLLAKAKAKGVKDKDQAVQVVDAVAQQHYKKPALGLTDAEAKGLNLRIATYPDDDLQRFVTEPFI